MVPGSLDLWQILAGTSLIFALPGNPGCGQIGSRANLGALAVLLRRVWKPNQLRIRIDAANRKNRRLPTANPPPEKALSE